MTTMNEAVAHAARWAGSPTCAHRGRPLPLLLELKPLDSCLGLYVDLVDPDGRVGRLMCICYPPLPEPATALIAWHDDGDEVEVVALSAIESGWKQVIS